MLQKPDLKGLKELADSLLLHLDDSEYQLLEREFAGIISQFERMTLIDTHGVAPTDFVAIPVAAAVPRMRADAPGDERFTINDMAANTPYILNRVLLVGGEK